VAPPPPPLRPGLESPAPTAGLGLQPLPSPQQVTQAVPQGRIDPFSDPRPPAPTQASPSTGGTPTRGTVPAGATGVSGSKSATARALPAALALQLSGVIQSGGKPEAIVVMGGESDSLRIGQQGSKETPLLPRGWSVESININACSLVLKQAGRLHTYNCANS